MAKQINVHSAFTLTRDDGSTEKFARGLHTVSNADAEHWYVKANAEVGAEVEDPDEEEEGEADEGGESDEKPLSKAERRALRKQGK